MADIGALIGDELAAYALISSKIRSIGTILPDVTLEEQHRDELSITLHPVERGAPISDHAFMNPVTVEMRVGFSNSSHQTEGYVDLVYQELLALQKSRVPFNVSTGKRQYTNMLIRSIAVTTDEKSEFALNAIVGLQEVIITSTQTAGAGSGPQNNSPDASNQADPAKTNPVENGGVQQLLPKDGAPSQVWQSEPNPYGNLSGVAFYQGNGGTSNGNGASGEW